MSNIPPNIKKLFWEFQVSDLDVDLHKSSIIQKVLNYGTLADWRWLLSVYGQREIDKILKNNTVRAQGVRPESIALFFLLAK